MSDSNHNPSYIDTHCHVDLFPSPQRIVEAAEAERIHTIAVTNAPSVFHFTQSITKSCLYVRPALGLHPELVRTHGNELGRFVELLPQTRFVGEVGLDFVTADHEDRKRQLHVFETILARCADAGDKVLTIHSRRASADVIDAIGPSFPCVAILHWFSGPLRDLIRAAGAGLYFSVNPAMTKSIQGRKLITAMPQERILTETDAPFVKLDGRPAQPQDVSVVVTYFAALWKCTPEEARSRVHQNFARALGDFPGATR